MRISLPSKQKLELIGNLGTMLSSGIPILEAIESLEEEAKGNVKKVLTHLKSDIEQGSTVANSFESLGETFDSVTISLIRSAEESGNLDSTLKEITKYIKRNIEFSSKVKAALIYPSLVFVLFLGIMVVILTYVIPRIGDVFSKLKVQIPQHTKILIATSDFFLANYIYIGLGVVLFVIFGILLYKYKKRALTNFVFSLPLLSRLARNIDMARFAGDLGLLLESGVPITKAIGYAKNVALMRKTKDGIETAGFLVSGGKSLAEGFKRSPKIFPPTMVRITEAGEKSGTLENSLKELAYQFEAQTDESLKTITTVLEPALLVVIGLLVGGIMLSIIAPIYQLIGDITPR